MGFAWPGGVGYDSLVIGAVRNGDTMTDQSQAEQQQGPAVLSGGGMARAALVVMIAYVASAVLGVLRSVIITALFGAGPEVDAFVAAQRVPELLFNLVAGGALGSAFIPVFAGLLAEDRRDEAWRMTSAVITLLTLVTLALAVVTYIAAPWIVQTALRPGDTPAQQALAVDLMRIMLSTVVIFGVSGLMMGILNAHQHFWRPAAAMSFYNLGIIAGAILLKPVMGVAGLAWGTVLGALLHLAIQLPAVRHVGARLRPVFDPRSPGVGEVLRLMGPRIIGQGVVQFNFFIIGTFTSFMVDGAQTVVTMAFTVMFTALGVIGQSLGTAVFPSLSTLATQEDMPGYRRTLGSALRSVLFLAIPASVGLIVLAQPVIGALYQRGAWSPAATAGAAWALQFFALGLVAHALLEILARAFYALHDTWTPVLVGLATMLLNIALNVVLIRVLGEPGNLARGSYAGLALAMTLATTIETTTLWLLLRRRIGGMDGPRVWALVWRTTIAALVMGGVLWGLQAVLLAGGNVYLVTVLGVVIGAGLFFGLALLLGVPEARTVPNMILRKVRR
jgi:putative peptidoglycan lipid II flippase